MCTKNSNRDMFGHIIRIMKTCSIVFVTRVHAQIDRQTYIIKTIYMLKFQNVKIDTIHMYLLLPTLIDVNCVTAEYLFLVIYVKNFYLLIE